MAELLLEEFDGTTNTLPVRAVFERSIGIKVELPNGNSAYFHPSNYKCIEVVK